jgi:hypothetical protein
MTNHDLFLICDCVAEAQAQALRDLCVQRENSRPLRAACEQVIERRRSK